MDRRQTLLAAIHQTAAEAAHEGRAVNINEMAVRLSSKHPQSGLTINDIAAMISEAAQRQSADTAKPSVPL